MDYLSIGSYKINILFLITLLSISFAGCDKSHATREINNSLQASAKESENIVLAECTGNKTEQTKSGLIFTVTTFSVEQVIKGTMEEDSFSVRILGGQKDDMNVNLPDRPEFSENEQVVLFLENKSADGNYIIQSFTDGIYRVSYDEETGVRYITSAVDNVKVFNSSTGKRIEGDEKIALDNFIYSVQRLLEE